MSKKALDMSGLLATKGEGAPANDAPTRQVVKKSQKPESTNRRNQETDAPPSSEFVNLGFKVPKEFRHRLRMIAAQKDTSLVEVLRAAVDLYEQAHIK
ncbi:hypothetical protein A1359_02180 [Methylomonas lenta]|jgi:hypothetical protein|uniref:Uncharacterized protein n=1 Tax=Methylomonas lenta TaxID=980561 RepID=A0A177MUC5_9GAMM|nr:hypothetical protein [Methylomonas lenta]OAI09347.1 hypothetical protein A1359_02180 [Methylomonas lenta]